MAALGIPLAKHREFNRKLSSLSTPERVAKIEGVLRQRITRRVALGIQDVTNPHNIAAIFRTADCFGLQRVFTLGKANKYSNDAASGSGNWMTVIEEQDPRLFWQRARQEGFQVCSSDLSPGAIPYDELEKTLTKDGKYLFVFGSEGQGISEETRANSDVRWYFPMSGLAQSFNVSVSVAILLANLKRSGILSPSDLTPEEYESLKTRWLFRSLDFNRSAASALFTKWDPDQTTSEALLRHLFSN